jgi:hypothetical protein
MKVCPNCNQTYTDESLNFCLNDGATLTRLKTDDPPPTVMMNSARTTSPNFTDRPNFTEPNNPFGGANAPLSTGWQPSPSPSPVSQSPFGGPPLAASQFAGQNQTLPTISLVLGILGLLLFCCYGGLPLGIAAMITGYLGLNNANNDPQQYGGRGLAIGGLITGGLSLLGTIVLILIAIAANL